MERGERGHMKRRDQSQLMLALRRSLRSDFSCSAERNPHLQLPGTLSLSARGLGGIMLPLALMLTLASACSHNHSETPTNAPPSERAKLIIYTSLAPLAEFTERLGGDAVEVTLATPPGEDPASWVPSAELLLAYQRADLIVLNGAQFEGWRSQVSLPSSRVLESAGSFRERWLHYPESQLHRHGEGPLHRHEGIDGHTWLDPLLALEQARAIYVRLGPLIPETFKAELQERMRALEETLRSLDRAWAALAPKLRNRKILANHPAYQYLATRYQLSIESFDLDPAEPLPAHFLNALSPEVSASAPALIFWEAMPIEESRAMLLSRGIESVWVNPAEGVDPAGKGYLERQQSNIERLTAALGDTE